MTIAGIEKSENLLDKRAFGNIVAIDYGRKRVGLAGCQTELPIAFGITTLTINGLNDLMVQIKPILRERCVQKVVIGFPLTLGDKPGTLKAEILQLGKLLQSEGLTVHFVDEALSSRRAGAILRKRGRRARKSDHDRTAAALILQEFLEGRLPPLSPEEIDPGQRESSQD